MRVVQKRKTCMRILYVKVNVNVEYENTFKGRGWFFSEALEHTVSLFSNQPNRTTLTVDSYVFRGRSAGSILQ